MVAAIFTTGYSDLLYTICSVGVHIFVYIQICPDDSVEVHVEVHV